MFGGCIEDITACLIREHQEGIKGLIHDARRCGVVISRAIGVAHAGRVDIPSARSCITDLGKR